MHGSIVGASLRTPSAPSFVRVYEEFDAKKFEAESYLHLDVTDFRDHFLRYQ